MKLKMRIESTQMFAGFWLRLCAFFIDSVIICAGIWLVQLISYIPMNLNPAGIPMKSSFMIGFNLFSVIIVWLYYALFESSAWCATIGKRLVKIKVTGLSGDRISFARATGRHFAKIFSSLIFFIGYLMIFFTKKQQGLHDIIAETLVVRS